MNHSSQLTCTLEKGSREGTGLLGRSHTNRSKSNLHYSRKIENGIIATQVKLTWKNEAQLLRLLGGGMGEEKLRKQGSNLLI